jgi:hypothetical protein
MGASNKTISKKQFSDYSNSSGKRSRERETPTKDLIDKEFAFITPKIQGLPKSPLEIYERKFKLSKVSAPKKGKNQPGKSGFDADVKDDDPPVE